MIIALLNKSQAQGAKPATAIRFETAQVARVRRAKVGAVSSEKQIAAKMLIQFKSPNGWLYKSASAARLTSDARGTVGNRKK